MRKRAVLADESEDISRATVGMQITTTSAPAIAAPIHIAHFLRSTFGAMRRSWAEVSRIIFIGLPRDRIGIACLLSKQWLCHRLNT